MAKNIVFCADGTWNNPYEDQDQDHCADPTNVYKLFLNLAGELAPDTLRCADEQEKNLVEGGDVLADPDAVVGSLPRDTAARYGLAWAW